ncbi:uncharacterized protein LOC107360898 isoform X2 [Tetranychus urticae]|uniref:F-box domain-containing protein n=1 Tax=Tetranychus urticae TaxID=32264 RepID=T1K4F4_TETUR|nr:uncharacterized protein LOC107360898 isoform X2 [Tetranychus urticae]
MLINELPDDCLLAILDYIQDLKDLINCFKVCEKWSNVIVGRTRRVKYLINKPNYSPDYVCNYVNRPIDVTCLSKLFPNLRIAYLSSLLFEKEPIEDIVKVIRDSESLKGIIFDEKFDFVLMAEIADFQMLSIGYINPNISEIYGNMKQLCLDNSNLDLFELGHHFPNLERFQYRGAEPYPDGPVLANLKILEMEISHDYFEDDYCSFVLMDSCPALQSAHISMKHCPCEVNYSIKLANLQDLVLEFFESKEWSSLRRLMVKYPNLKHLALQRIYLSEEEIVELIQILPKLTLLDVRKSYSVFFEFTQETADHVQDYCKRYGRSIKFYFKAEDKQIESDWPQILNRPDKICRGFDFMEHCFFKDFTDLPYFLDPIDD